MTKKNHKLKTVVVKKAPLCKAPEHLFVDPPYTLIGTPHLPDSMTLTMKVGGLKQMLDGLGDKDTFRIEVFGDNRASEFSFIRHEDER